VGEWWEAPVLGAKNEKAQSPDYLQCACRCACAAGSSGGGKDTPEHCGTGASCQPVQGLQCSHVTPF
jgi:hypothetical protein